jgi:hypothetical protein
MSPRKSSILDQGMPVMLESSLRPALGPFFLFDLVLESFCEPGFLSHVATCLAETCGDATSREDSHKILHSQGIR